MSLIEDQKEREAEMVSRGVDRFNRAMEMAKEKGRHFDMAPYSTVLHAMTAKLLPHVTAMLDDIHKTIERRAAGHPGRPSNVDVHLCCLDPVVTSYIIVRSMLQKSGVTKHTLCANIAAILQVQRQFDLMQEEDNASVQRLMRTVKVVQPKNVRKWTTLLNKVTKVEWDWETRVKLGLQLLAIALDALPDYVFVQNESKVVGRRTQWVTEVKFTPELQQQMIEEEKRLALDSPWLTPMVCQPKQWSQTESGGYLMLDHNLIKDNYYGVRVSKSMVIPQAVCDAVNNLSNVPWRVNKAVLAVAEEAIRHGCKEILPVEPTRPLPEPIEDAVWEVMDKEQRGKHKTARRLVHDHNNRLESKRHTMRRTVAVAQEYADYESIYFPHNLDFRGRAYPLPQDLNPQGDDFTRSLLQFAEGKMVDEDAMCWIMHSAASAYGGDEGTDKMSLSEQVEWCRENLQKIAHVARNPLGTGYDFLCEADEPWQFLAACIDIEQCMNCWDDGGSYYSHLPVHVDGSCNGLQHLSAMGRDPVGAKAVNLTEGPRQDIYQDVADKVISSVEDDVEGYHFGSQPTEQGRAWRGKVTRKTVKRGVMTTPYGVTPEGIRRQLIDDRMLEGVPGDTLANATYMRDRMVEAIDDTIIVGKQIMAWMQNVARQLCAEQKPVTWTTPIGFVCSQAYRKPSSREYKTLAGKVKVVEPNPNGELRASKQVNSIAPNIVHSFDAAHLMMTANRAAEQKIWMGTVHDSYGTHACDVDALGRILRQTFVEIYSQDQLENLKNSFIQCAGRYEDWMEPPVKGDFDIREVLKSEYFFF